MCVFCLTLPVSYEWFPQKLQKKTTVTQPIVLQTLLHTICSFVLLSSSSYRKQFQVDVRYFNQVRALFLGKSIKSDLIFINPMVYNSPLGVNVKLLCELHTQFRPTLVCTTVHVHYNHIEVSYRTSWLGSQTTERFLSEQYYCAGFETRHPAV